MILNNSISLIINYSGYVLKSFFFIFHSYYKTYSEQFSKLDVVTYKVITDIIN